MPNWTYNIIKTNNPTIIPSLMDDAGNFDFNKLIPMPESLNIESGSNVDRAICYYVSERLTIPVAETNLSKLISNSFSNNWAEEVASRVAKWAEEASDKEKDKLYAMGEQYVFNRQNYGFFTWYEWNIANWGTKWNSVNSSFDEKYPCSISFDTAWSAPEPIFQKMCEMFPNAEITFHCDYEEGFVTEYENQNGELVLVNEYDYMDDEDEYEDDED